jgi:phosphate transport system substrate-binding protein
MKRYTVRALCAVLALSLGQGSLVACGERQNREEGGFGSKQITVVSREDGSGTKSAFMEIIGLKGQSDVRGVIISASTAAVLTEVRSNPYAIAYESLGYVTDDVKTLQVDGVEPTREHIRDGAYKLTRPFALVYKEVTVAAGAGQAFLAFLQSTAAQAIIDGRGYVFTKENPEAYTVNPSLSGTVTVSGSTSLQPLMMELADAFMSLQPGVTVQISGGGSGTGYKNAKDGVSDFGMISETFRPENAPGCVSYEVALDGMAVIVHRQNPLDSISLETLKHIYDADAGDTAVRFWSQVR